MAKRPRKLISKQKAAKKRRRREYMTIFIPGKQNRVKRPPTIDGMDVEEFIRNNADPIWLHQNELWEYMEPEVSLTDEDPEGNGLWIEERADEGDPCHPAELGRLIFDAEPRVHIMRVNNEGACHGVCVG